MNLFDRAAAFAVEKHSGQTRKKSNAPYILHPMEVAAIVGTMSEDEELLAAAILHDTVEDTDTTLEEIEALFGRRVSLLVMTETEEKREDRPPAETWELRKEETLAILKTTRDLRVKKLWLGDKLSNLRSFARQYRVSGDDLWKAYHQQDPKKQKWYYGEIAEALADLREYDAYLEFMQLMNYIFQNVK